MKTGSLVRRRCIPLLALMIISGAHAATASLFDRMGGEPVLHRTVERFTDIIIADDRINFSFAETDLTKFKQLLHDQLCSLSGGPCHYGGRDMATAHAKLQISTAQFNALAEDLYLALQQCGVPYRLQNRLMAMLAPMKRDIVKHGQEADTSRRDSRTD